MWFGPADNAGFAFVEGWFIEMETDAETVGNAFALPRCGRGARRGCVGGEKVARTKLQLRSSVSNVAQMTHASLAQAKRSGKDGRVAS